ncbi:hypothetical protein LR24_08240 [Lacticaseibacillus rhamnosus]|uniref:hypothetical protein n=1 Tax=Lacticaseibacillus TaxID=2759736 RepID=UPI00050199A3|nr:hypothetical protein [Lacticaseibacillus rhamnosus]KFK46269.1 hypothetical protein LR24_08240 [Lacticaseibacillus rhamnosus]
MLIKLDSGKLLNISAVSYISNTEMLAYFKQPVITNENNFETAKCFGVGVTEADIERIANNNANKEVTDDEV